MKEFGTINLLLNLEKVNKYFNTGLLFPLIKVQLILVIIKKWADIGLPLFLVCQAC